ncbi:MAG: DUF4838 domain-containing protein [Lentisphaeria bacterium]|nr:DUF4838 domain-containing protein [Lentisphaeria bacterium]
MKKLFIGVMLICSMAVSAAEFVFADKGKANFTIVLPEKAVGFEEQAAKDLQEFFKKMSGADFKIVKESAAPAKNAIYIGNTGFAKKANINVDKLTAETWVIKTVGNNLILSGGYPVGAFYGAWDILHKLGCYAITWDNYSTPKQTRLALDVKDVQKKPAFDGRLMWDSIAGTFRHQNVDQSVRDAYKIWKLRAGINGSQGKGDPALWKYSAHNICQTPAWHSLSQFVSPKLFAKHPEYFSMNAFGKRFKPKTAVKEGSLCMSNPDVKRITLESLRKMIKKDRANNPKDKWATVYDISTLDNSPFICYCPECKKITNYEGSETGLLLQYINYVATEIKKEYPEIIIRTYGYSASATPPKKIFPADNVLIQLTDKFTVSDPYRPLTHPINADRHEYFKEWRKGAKRLMVWDYWNLGGNYFKPPHPATVINSIKPDLQYYRNINVTDMFIEAGRNRFVSQSFMDLSYFVGSQLMIDPDQDLERLIDIYFNSYFGPAAKEMKKIFTHMREGTMKQKNRQTTAVVAHWNYLTPEYVYNSYATMKKLAATLPQPYKQRVNSELVPFAWYAVAKRPSYRAIFKKNGVNIDDLVEEVRTLAKAHIRRLPCKTPAKVDAEFEKKYAADTLVLKRPEKFKHVPDEHFRMISASHFRGVSNLGSKVTDDPESLQGKALRSANTNPFYHGINKLISKKHKFYTTQFKWGNHKAPGGVEVILTEVAQDEKYHWYRLPGRFEMRDIAYFSGQGWAIQANTSNLYVLTDGNPLDNTWDQIWVSAKFTGPAYVKGSTKPNAIWVDMAVLVRNVKDEQFAVPTEYQFKAAAGSALKNWQGAKSAFKTDVKDGRGVIDCNALPKGGRILAPMSPITNKDTITLELRSNVRGARVGIVYYDKNKKNLGTKYYKTNGSELDRFVADLNHLKFKNKNAADVASFRLIFELPKEKAIKFDQIELRIGKDINKIDTK